MSEALYVLATGACAMCKAPGAERIWWSGEKDSGRTRIIFWYSDQSVASCAEEAWKRFVDACEALCVETEDASTESNYIVVIPERTVGYEEEPCANPVWMPR